MIKCNSGIDVENAVSENFTLCHTKLKRSFLGLYIPYTLYSKVVISFDPLKALAYLQGIVSQTKKPFFAS